MIIFDLKRRIGKQESLIACKLMENYEAENVIWVKILGIPRDDGLKKISQWITHDFFIQMKNMKSFSCEPVWFSILVC